MSFAAATLLPVRRQRLEKAAAVYANLTVQIAALRRPLEEHAGSAGWIETLPRRAAIAMSGRP